MSCKTKKEAIQFITKIILTALDVKMKYVLLSILLVFVANCTALFKNNVSSQKNQKMNIDRVSRIDIPINKDTSIKPDTTFNNKRSIASAHHTSSVSCSVTSKKLSEKYGEPSIFKFDNSSIEDYLLGAKPSFDLKCARMYLDMSQLSRTSPAYRGTLTISSEDSQSFRKRYSSGSTKTENKYNRWAGSSWRDHVDRKFYAIFEDRDAALILKLDKIKKAVKAGKTTYLGDGVLYYKMFRMWTGDKSDVCYSKGTYVNQFPHQKPIRQNRCWLLGIGPFSCRPEGSLPPRAEVTDIDLTGPLKCYKRLGIFFNLNIKDAFNGLSF